MPARGFFKPGNHYSKGRPPKSKNQIERIRSRILRVVKKRIYHEKELETVTTTELLKFLASIWPREGIHIQAPQLNYISNIPREETTGTPPVELPPATTEVLNSAPPALISDETAVTTAEGAPAALTTEPTTTEPTTKSEELSGGPPV